MTDACISRSEAFASPACQEIEPLSERDAQLAHVAQHRLMAVLDPSRAQKIVLLADGETTGDAPVLVIPPAALNVFARVLGMMGERKPITLIPHGHDLSTQEVADRLNVSRPFIIQEIERGRLMCHMVGSHRRVPYEEMVRYRDAMKADQELALQELADEAQQLGMGYR